MPRFETIENLFEMNYFLYFKVKTIFLLFLLTLKKMSYSLCRRCVSMSSENLLMDQFSSVAQSCLTLCNPRNRSTPGLLVHHQLLEFTQTHVHWVSDYQLLKLRIQIYLGHKKWTWYSYFRGSWLEDFIPHSNFWQSIKWRYFSGMNKTLNLL